MASSSGDTAGLLILIGLILQFVEVVVIFLLGLFLLSLTIFGGLFLVAGVFGLIWLVVVYVFAYSRVQDGQYEEAQVPTLVCGILTLLFGGIVSGILYIVAYLKLGDAVREEVDDLAADAAASTPPAGAAGFPLPAATVPRGDAPGSVSRFCAVCGTAVSPTARFCKNCGAAIQ